MSGGGRGGWEEGGAAGGVAPSPPSPPASLRFVHECTRVYACVCVRGPHLVELVLKVDERVVVGLSELHPAQNGAHHEGTRHVFDRRLDPHDLARGRLDDLICRGWLEALEDAE